MIEAFEIERVNVFKNETGWFVASALNKKGELVSVVGVAFMPPHGKITAEGEWQNHTTYGRQFKAVRIIYDSALDVMLQLLASGFLEQVKVSKAIKMVEALGDRAFEILDACILNPAEKISWNGQMKLPEDILLTVNGIGPKVIKQILSSWRARRGIMGVAILGIRAGMGAPQFREALNILGEVALTDYILNNPYKLTTVRGITFADADLIAQLAWENKTPIPLDSPTRLGAALREVIDRQKERGHMCFPLEQALRDVEQLIQMHPDDVWDICCDRLDQLDLVYYDTEPPKLATLKSYQTEQELAAKVVELQKAQFKPFIDEKDLKKLLALDFDINAFSGDIRLTDMQRHAIELAIKNPVSLITGGPGTGKTTIIKTLLNIFDEYGITYTLASFIAKVAIRMREATGREAGTLHSIFEVYKDKKEWLPLETDYLIMDEGSTVSEELLHDVMSMVRPGQRVLIVGDSNQLPPIGPGEPFTSLLEVLPCVELDKIFRQADTSGIVLAAHDILHGVNPTKNNKDVWIIDDSENEYALVQRMIKAADYFMSQGLTFTDVQVLTSVNGGPIGRSALNKVLQDYYNPTGQDIVLGGKIPVFRLGDKVIHTKNNPKVKNGEVGIIVRAEVQGSPNDLSLQDNGNDWSPKPPVLWVQYPYHDNPEGYTKEEVATELQLAYAVTIHKSIGSEYGAGIVMLPVTRRDFMFRQLIYTGITRFKKGVAIMSTAGTISQYVGNSIRQRRHTVLANLIARE